ncbi:threonine synthase [Caballeronia arvi]|uniref:Threonine synthase n=1 Tax=Caballeronia arvi TaxID=1777135 RepID=A0A158J5C1_9BURK|nr:threonine synthase [Caballeronia arvi]SAL63549.1 threonine synthase [Caballeronia arvi]
MRYISTRGGSVDRRFSEVLMEGLAPDGGLYVPATYPKVDDTTLRHWRSLSYAELALQIVSLYIDDIPAHELRAIIASTYTPEVFGSAQIVPLQRLDESTALLNLSNGPTFAFKDIAMQFLGNLFEAELGRRGARLNILGATSGDTGSAAEYAMRGKQNVQVFMLSPRGRMSPFQQAQMFSLQDKNIHNLVVEGSFDTCQDIVKAVSADLAFKRQYDIGTVNSINWARLLAQVVYYFSGYFQATNDNSERVSFCVPSGNFGNICAGHVARMMGLPIEKLVLATNENDVLDEFFKTGRYRVRSSRETMVTSSPSMDISKASNFERFIFDLLGRDAHRVGDLFDLELSQRGQFCLTEQETACIARYGFVSGKSTHLDRLQTISHTWQRHRTMIDPHTADGVKVAREHLRSGIPTIVLETALPLKFQDIIREAIGQEAPRPVPVTSMEQRPRRCELIAPSADEVKAYMERHCSR